MKEKYLHQLSEDEKSIFLDGRTELPFSGEYNDFYLEGVYVCKSCNAKLFKSASKFKSDCGWPSFDNVIESAIFKKRDFSLGRIRTEIICANCEGHLGHVFDGENHTETNTRYCVNSLSLKFIPKTS